MGGSPQAAHGRRAFLALAAASVLAPSARAQVVRTRRVGVLMVNSPEDPEQLARLAHFRDRLGALGWTEGRNVAIEVLWSSGSAERSIANVRQMVASQPDVIVSSSTPVTIALQRETRTIPVVFIFVADPVRSGLVKSLAHPGANITGLVNIEPTLLGKWLELLKEIAPGVQHVTVAFNPETAPYAPAQLAGLDPVAARLALRASTATVRTTDEIDALLATLGREQGSGLVTMADSFLAVHRKLLVTAAARHRVPAIYFSDVHVADGGLISYGIDATDLFQRAAPYVDRILRGATAGELPVEQPIKFQLAVNVRTARALGLSVPASMLLRADRVVE